MDAIDYDDFFYSQFVLSEADAAPFESWRTRSIGPWHLHFHKALYCHELRSGDDPVGLMLGYAIGPDGILLDEDKEILISEEDTFNEDVVENFIYGYGGRYICLVRLDGVFRLYLDPAGSLSCVYSILDKEIASTNSILYYFHYKEVLQPEAVPKRLDSNQFYPGGLTCQENVYRLMPNHYLNLQNWQYYRHWPKRHLEPFTASESKNAMDVIATRLKQNIDAVLSKKKTYIGITAGKDSRMLLACCRDFQEHLSLFTFDYGVGRTSHDVVSGRKIAEKMRIPHDIVKVIYADEQEKIQYLMKIGFNGNPGKASDFFCTPVATFDMNNAFIPGFSGEIGRAYYRLYSFAKIGNHQTKHLLGLIHLPDEEPYLSAITKWYNSIKDLVDEKTLFDLLFLEQRTGCWSSVHLYGFAPFSLVLNPFSHRDIYSNMIRMYDDHKLEQELPKLIMKKFWPRLTQFPFVVREKPGKKKLTRMDKLALRYYAIRSRLRQILRIRSGESI
jgi:hypothetical protein